MRSIEEAQNELGIHEHFMKSFVNKGVVSLDENNMISDRAFEDFKARIYLAEETVNNALQEKNIKNAISLTDDDMSELDNL